MAKLYNVPCMRVIDLTTEEGILAISGDKNLSVELTEDTAGGHEALSQKKSIWENEGIWK